MADFPAYDHLMQLERQLTDTRAKVAGPIRAAGDAINAAVPLNDTVGSATYVAIRDELYALARKAESTAHDLMRGELAAAWTAAKEEEERDPETFFSMLGDQNPWEG